MHEINLLFLLSSISFVAGLATVSLVNLLKNQNKYRLGKGIKYIGVLSLSLIIGSICNYLYKHNWLGSFIFIPCFIYALFTILIYYMTNLYISIEPKSVSVDPATKFYRPKWPSLRQSNTRNQMNSLRSDIDCDGGNSVYSIVSKVTAETKRRQNKIKYDGEKSKFVDKRL